MQGVLDYLFSPKPWVSIAVVVAAIVVWRVLFKRFAKALLDREQDAARRSNMQISANVLKYVVVVVVCVVVMRINGIDVAGLATGLGIAGIVVGFALQDILKDLIMGASIAWDGYFSIGDVIRYKDFEGKVLSMNLKSTKIELTGSKNVVTISNRNISEVEVLTGRCSIDVPLPYDISAGEARATMQAISDRIAELDSTAGCDVLGTQEFGDSSILYRVRAFCDPADRPVVRRQMLGCAQDVIEERGIEIPYNQLDVRVK